MKCKVLCRKQLFWIAAVAAWLILLAVIVTLTATKAVNAQAKRLPVYSVARGDKKIALTFNCAWGNETTDAVLSLLKENGVPATFFIVGTFAQKYPESVKKIYNAGHQLGNHSMRHKDPVKQTPEALAADMEECGALLYSLTGVSPGLYRAPAGSYDNKTVETAERLGMTAVQWSADSIDWKDPSPEVITQRVLKRVSPGGILLFHLGKENTLRALPDIIRQLAAQGYEFVTVGELLLQGGTFVDANGVQRAK